MPDIMQHEARQNYMFRDQHGREWLAIVDTRTKPYLAPCTQPWPQFRAPIMPEGTLLVPDPTQLGRLNINYAKWEEQATLGERVYLDTLQVTAEKMFGYKATEAIERRDPRLMEAMGPAPVSPLFVQAAAAGNKWVLGLVDASEVPTWAHDHLQTLPQYRPKIESVVTGFSASAFPDLADELVTVGAADEADDVPVTTAKRGPGRPRKEG